MSINFNPDPASCATYGYSYGYACPDDGITHTIAQNWRVMLDPSGATFYAPVSTVASVDTSTGPKGPTGMTGMTGMTGSQGIQGNTGPQGFTFDGIQNPRGLVYLDELTYGGSEVNGITLSSSNVDTVGITNSFLQINKVTENIQDKGNWSAHEVDNGNFIVVDAAVGNYQYFDVNVTTLADVKGFKLINLQEGTYLTIACKRISTGGNPSTFKSQFETFKVGSGTEPGTKNIHYATGLTYDMGAVEGDLDVFYVSVLSLTSNAIDLIVNHQRYHD